MVTTIGQALRRRARASLCVAWRHLLALLKPATIKPVGGALGDLVRTRAELVAEHAFLRQQLIVLRRQVKRPVLTPAARCRLVLLARLTRGWQAALLIVQPGTRLRWHRQGFRLRWRAKSAAASQRPQVPEETVALIGQLAAENRLWGAERIRGGLLTLGIRVAKRTVQRHLRPARPPWTSGRGQTRATFVRNHAEAIWACAFLQVPDVTFRSLVALVIVDLGSRRVVHVGVTRHPTDAWAAQQLRGATPCGVAPLPDPRQRQHIRGTVRPRCSGQSDCGSAHPDPGTAGERCLRALPRQRPPRVPRPPPHPRRVPLAPRAPRVLCVLQRGTAAPGAGAGDPGGSGSGTAGHNRGTHRVHPGPGWPPP